MKKKKIDDYLLLPDTRRNLWLSFNAFLLSILVPFIMSFLERFPEINIFVWIVRGVLLALTIVYYVIYRLQLRALDKFIISEMGKTLTPDGAVSLRRELLRGKKKI
jgi:hypothetical protein